MHSEFWIWLSVQAALLASLVVIGKVRISQPARVFGPVGWFLLFYSLVFFLPQVMMPIFDFTLIGAYNRVTTGAVEGVVRTQQVLTVFLIAATGALAATHRPSLPTRGFTPLSPGDFQAGAALAVIGGIAVAIMLAGFDGAGARSSIVASTPGKLLYALSFWLTLGYFTLAAWLLKRRRYILLLVTTLVFAAALLPLGGRGRILWPIAGLVAWVAITGHRRIRFGKLAIAAVLLGITLQALDPLLLYLRGYDSSTDAIARFSEGLQFETWFFGRNFDAFHNLAVIVNSDRIPPDLGYLLQGVQPVFMKTYFPAVAASGVGYPATLPGGLWLTGQWTMIAIGGAAFGLLLGALSRIYGRLASERAVVVYCIALPWLAHVGISYLDSFLKMAALILPGVLWCMMAPQRRVVVRPALRSRYG